MKKLLSFAVILLGLGLLPTAKAQLYNPYYAYYCGPVYFMPVAGGSGYYTGPVVYGFAHGEEGYVYYYDMNLGCYIAYHGGFNGGLFHGKGELLCQYGYMYGQWYNGILTQQLSRSQEEIQTSVNNIQRSRSKPNSIDLSNVKTTVIDNDSELGRMLGGRR